MEAAGVDGATYVSDDPYEIRIVRYALEDPESLLAHPKNPKIHPKAQSDALDAAMREVGILAPVLINEVTQHCLDGHDRIGLFIARGQKKVPTLYVNVPEEKEGTVLATFDPIGALAVMDQAVLDELIDAAHAQDEVLVQFLANLRSESSLPTINVAPKPTLSDRFIVPPFSVLDARQGYWQDRKRQWLSIGIQSELGRGENPGYAQVAVSDNGLLGFSEQARSHYKTNATPGGSTLPPAALGADGKTVRGDGRGRKLADGRDPGRIPGQDLMRGEHSVGSRLTWVAGELAEKDLDETSRKNLAAGRQRAYTTQEWVNDHELEGLSGGQSGTSIFDPVLCELAYRWFCPMGGHVLDPMAGGSVRGIVASILGRRYTGIDLRQEQIQANAAQLHIAGDPPPAWITGDSLDAPTIAAGEYDFIFSCPPYADLERYSDDPRDLSTMGYEDFLVTYRKIIAACCDMLAADRFACFVVGDVRDDKGIYRGFVGDTITAFEDAGLSLYNEAILVTAVGSLPIRVGKQFVSSRKLGKTHQNVLVFVKGDARKATEACGEVDVTVPDELSEEWLVSHA